VRKHIAPFVLIAAATLGLSGCQTTSGMRSANNEAIGTAGGALVGALLGKAIGGDTEAVVIGGLVGSMIGNRIGAHLDSVEQQRLANAVDEAVEAPVGQRVQWANIDPATNQTTASGWAEPVTDIQRTADGRDCRVVRQYVSKSGEAQTQDVTMCNGSSGWVGA